MTFMQHRFNVDGTSSLRKLFIFNACVYIYSLKETIRVKIQIKPVNGAFRNTETFKNENRSPGFIDKKILKQSQTGAMRIITDANQL